MGKNMHIRNTCKECLASSYSLKLSEDLLCPDCVKYHQLSSNNGFDNGASLSKACSQWEASSKAYDALRKREKKNFDFIYNNYCRARELEKNGQLDEALDIYLRIVEYYPPGTDYYTRPCIILEKKKEYALAIEICDLAIKGIQEKRYNADENEFIHRKNRLIKKMSK